MARGKSGDSSISPPLRERLFSRLEKIGGGGPRGIQYTPLVALPPAYSVENIAAFLSDI